MPNDLSKPKHFRARGWRLRIVFAFTVSVVSWTHFVNQIAFSQQVQFPSSSGGAAPGTLTNPNPWTSSPTPTGTFPPGSGTSGWPPPPSYGSTLNPPSITPIGPTTVAPGNTGLSSPGVSIRPNSSPMLPPTYTGVPAASSPYAAQPYAAQPNLSQPFGTTPSYTAQPYTQPYNQQPSSPWGLGNLFGTNAPPTYAAPSAYGYPTNGYPTNGAPIVGAPINGYPTAAPVFSNTYPPSAYPNTAPPTLFPGSFGTAAPVQAGNPYGMTPFGAPMNQPYGMAPTAVNVWDPNTWQSPSGPMLNNNFTNDPLGYTSRFFVTPRFRHSWINGNNGPTALETNDSEVSFLFQIPRWLGSTQPLYMAPAFAIHLWDGPRNGTADLPGSAYSAFLDFGWESNPNQTFGLETGIRIGVFTDFNTFNSDSLRIPGKIIGRARLTPTATARIGAYWLDRNRIKLLPAAGILWTPNPDTRFDLFFPEPKLAHYLSTIGNKDCWWYVTGYYGGGAWTIQRADGSSDDIDLNDIRVCLGLEWGRNEALRLGQRFAFFEGGYAFNREVIYRVRPQNNLDLDNSFILRAGFIY